MWDVELAKMFKERNNVDKIGNCIGKVVASNPLKIEILNGEILLREEQLYITDSATDKEYKMKLEAGTGIGDIAINNLPSNPLITLNVNAKDKTKLNLYFELKEGDEVLLVPTENEQKFCIVDKVRKVGG